MATDRITNFMIDPERIYIDEYDLEGSATTGCAVIFGVIFCEMIKSFNKIRVSQQINILPKPKSFMNIR